MKKTSPLKLLDDGSWHEMKELQEKTTISRKKIEKVVRTLKEMELVELKESDDKIEEIKINTLGLKVLEL